MVVANEIFLDFMFSQYSLIKLGRFLAFLSHLIRFLFLFFSGFIIRFLKKFLISSFCVSVHDNKEDVMKT